MVNENNTDITIIDTYVREQAFLASRELNIPLEQATKKVLTVLENEKANGTIENPIVQYYGKNKYGDRVLKEKPLTNYFDGARSGIIVPSGTVYASHEDSLSIHAENTAMRVAKRSQCKKEGFLAEQRGDIQEYNLKEKMQKTYKTGNNSITGLFDNQFNPHYCPSSHYSLTSTTASVTSIGNSIGESMVAGNRIYTKPEVVISHLTSTMMNSDKEKIKLLIKKYNLHIPTVDECFYIIIKSTRFYWSSEEKDSEIMRILNLMDDEDRVAFMYVNDLYHFREYNSELLRDIISKIVEIKYNAEIDFRTVMKDIPEDIEILTKSILYDTMLVHAQNEEVIDFKNDEFKETKCKIASTALNIKQILEEYDDLIVGFFKTGNLPINIADIKQVVRKCTVLSDTDSTCSTYQDWSLWYNKSSLPKFDSKEIGISGTVLMFFARTLEHSLNLFSRRMNIKGRYTKLLAMKNEFYWKTMIFMGKTKHYFADTAIREGSVFKKTKLELKGSNLINSKLPATIKKLSDDYFKKINKIITSGNIINLHELVNDIANIERMILDKLEKLDSEFMKEETILDHSSYKGGKLRSAYYHIMLWNEVFGPKYGEIKTTPVVTVKVKTNMLTSKMIEDGLESITDDGIKQRFKSFMKKYPKNRLETLRLPKEVVLGTGIPKEIENIITIRNAVEELCTTFYLILESVGFYKKPNMLLSDTY